LVLNISVQVLQCKLREDEGAVRLDFLLLAVILLACRQRLRGGQDLAGVAFLPRLGAGLSTSIRSAWWKAAGVSPESLMMSVIPSG